MFVGLVLDLEFSRHSYRSRKSECVTASKRNDSKSHFFKASTASAPALAFLRDAMDEVNMALRLMYLDGCSHEDIAASSSTSVSNGGTRISRIKQKLKDSLTCGANMELEELKLAWQHA